MWTILGKGTWVQSIHNQSGVGSCEDSVQWLLSKPAQPRPGDCMSQSQTAAHLKHTKKDFIKPSLLPKAPKGLFVLHEGTLVKLHPPTHHRRCSFQDATRWVVTYLWLGGYRKEWSQCWTYRWSQQTSVCRKKRGQINHYFNKPFH